MERSRVVQGLLTILFALLVQHYFGGSPAERHTPAMSYTSPEYTRVGPSSPFGYQLFHFTDYLVPRPGHQPYLRWVQDSRGIGVELVPWGAEGGRGDIHESIVPVLFVHGNSGHYSEGRGLGGAIARAQEAAAQTKRKLKQTSSTTGNGPHRVEMFTIDFREEANIHSAEVVLRQAVFVNQSITFLQSLFPKHTEQQGVWIVAHSMGGVISRLLPLVRAFGVPFRMDSTESLEQMVAEAESAWPLSEARRERKVLPPPPIAGLILLASPQVVPPVIMDADIALLYESVRHSWGEGFSAWAGFNASVGIRDLVCLPSHPVSLNSMDEWRGWGTAVEANEESRRRCESTGGALFPIRWFTEGLPVLSFAGGPLDFMIHTRLTWTEHGTFHRSADASTDNLEKVTTRFLSGDLSVRDIVSVSRPLSHQSITWGLPWLHSLGELIVTLALQVPNEGRSRSQSNPNPNPNPVQREPQEDPTPLATGKPSVLGPTFNEGRWVDDLLPSLATLTGRAASSWKAPKWLQSKFRTAPLPSYGRALKWNEAQGATTGKEVQDKTINTNPTLRGNRLLILSIGAAHRWAPEVVREGKQPATVTYPVIPGVGLHGLGPKFDPLPETVHHAQRADGTMGTITGIKSWSIIDVPRTEGNREERGHHSDNFVVSSVLQGDPRAQAGGEVQVQIRLPADDPYTPATVAVPLREWRYDSPYGKETEPAARGYSSAGPNCGLGLRAAPCAIRGQSVYSVVIAPNPAGSVPSAPAGADEPHWFPLVVARCGWAGAPNSKGEEQFFVDERILFPPHDVSKLTQPTSMSYKVHPPQDWFSATANLRKEQSLFHWDLLGFFADLVGLSFLSSPHSNPQRSSISWDPEWCSFTLIGDGSIYTIEVLVEPFYVQWVHRLVDGLRYPLVVILAILSFLLPFPYWLLRNATWCVKTHIQIKKSGRAGGRLSHKSPGQLFSEGSEATGSQHDATADPPSPLLRHVQRFPSLATTGSDHSGAVKENEGNPGQVPRAPSPVTGEALQISPGSRNSTPPPPLTASILFTQPLSYLHSMFHWQAKVKLYLGFCVLSMMYLTLRRGGDQLPTSASVVLLPYSLEEIVAISLGALCLQFVAMNIDEAFIKGFGIVFQLIRRRSLPVHSQQTGSPAAAATVMKPTTYRRRKSGTTTVEWVLGVYLVGFALFRSDWFLSRRLSVEDWSSGYVRKSLKDPLALPLLLFKLLCSDYDGAENVFHNICLNVIILMILSRTLVNCRLRAIQLTDPWRVPPGGGGVPSLTLATPNAIQRALRPNSRHLDILGRLWFYQIIGYMYFLTLPFVFSLKNAIMAPAAVPAAEGETLGTLLLIGLTCYVYRLSRQLEHQELPHSGRSLMPSANNVGLEDSDGGSDVNVTVGSTLPSGGTGGLRHRRVVPAMTAALASSSSAAPESDLRSSTTPSEKGTEPNRNLLLPLPVAVLRVGFCVAYVVVILSVLNKGYMAPLSVYYTRAGIQLLMSAVLLQEFVETVLGRFLHL